MRSPSITAVRLGTRAENIYVAVLPLGPHDAMGVTGECVCRYHNSRAASIEDVFYEPENDTATDAISLLD